jgi:hypothetical protein
MKPIGVMSDDIMVTQDESSPVPEFTSDSERPLK